MPLEELKILWLSITFFGYVGGATFLGTLILIEKDNIFPKIKRRKKITK